MLRGAGVRGVVEVAADGVERLRGNKLGTEGWCAIFGALRDNKDNKIESWDLSEQGINPEIAKVLAEYISVSTAVVSLKCVPYASGSMLSSQCACIFVHEASAPVDGSARALFLECTASTATSSAPTAESISLLDSRRTRGSRA